MKVRACTRDGQYLLEEYTKGHEEAGLSFSDITDEEWREYRDHMEKCYEWYDLILGLSNEQFAKDKEHEVKKS